MIPFLLLHFYFWEKLEELDQHSLVLREVAMKNPNIKTKIMWFYLLCHNLKSKNLKKNLLLLKLHATLSGFMVLMPNKLASLNPKRGEGFESASHRPHYPPIV